MDQSTKIEIVQALTSYMAEHKMSQADVAAKTGVRKEYLSLILKPESNFMYDAGGTKGFIATKYFNALAQLCKYTTERSYWQPQPTAQSNAILAYLQTAKEHHSPLVMVGETGCGKSFTSNLFSTKNPMDVFIVIAGSSDTLTDLLDKIMIQLHITNGVRSKSAKIRSIAEKLRMLTFQNYSPMLIIDESEYLKQPALCALKEIFDYVKDYCSLVLVGTHQLTENIQKLTIRNHSGIPQFHGRLKMGLRMLPNIDRAFLLFVNDIEDKDLKKFLLRNCNNYRELHDIIVPMTREADRLNEPLSIGLVRRLLNLPSGDLLW